MRDDICGPARRQVQAVYPDLDVETIAAPLQVTGSITINPGGGKPQTFSIYAKTRSGRWQIRLAAGTFQDALRTRPIAVGAGEPTAMELAHTAHDYAVSVAYGELPIPERFENDEPDHC